MYKRQEEKKALRKKKKQVMELEGYRDKLIEYDNHLDTLGERNSYSKTDPGATFMRIDVYKRQLVAYKFA